MRKLILSLVLALTSTMQPIAAAELPAASHTEIDTLLGRLGGSNCQFNRNGTWYSASDARTHLVKKLDYLIEKKKVDSTEQFIKLAASSSSMSGKDYQVRCGGAQPVSSQSWLLAELQAMRSKTPAAK
jgi:hypothetical protein